MFDFLKKAKANEPVDPNATTSQADIAALREEVARAFGDADDALGDLIQRNKVLDLENAAILALLASFDARVIDSLNASQHAKLVALAGERGIRTKAAAEEAEAKASRKRFANIEKKLEEEGKAAADAR